ncbi:hypothetical protein AKJ16_DCAP13500 [Drosera capensis]
MADFLTRLGGAAFLLLLLVTAAVEAVETESDEGSMISEEGTVGYELKTSKKKSKKLHCKQKGTSCYKKMLYCPAACARTCTFDCSNNCKTTCPTVTVSPPQLKPSDVPVPPPPPPPTIAPTKIKKVRCRNKTYPGCYYREYSCPASCPSTCEIDCVTCSPVCNCDRPGAVCQDPRFIGGDGLTFYFHGKKDHDFCLVTDPNLHINGHFIGKTNINKTRDFTWVQALGILFDNHQLYVGARKTAVWDDTVDRLDLTFDGEPVYLPESEGASWQFLTKPSVTITRGHTTNDVVMEVEGNFRIKATVVPITQKDSIIHHYGITNDDCFAHLDLSFKFYSLTGAVNGVLGQTYADNYMSRIKMGVQMPVLGGNMEFSSSSLFASDCAVSRFVGQGNLEDDNFEFDYMHCGGSKTGRGMACKH